LVAVSRREEAEEHYHFGRRKASGELLAQLQLAFREAELAATGRGSAVAADIARQDVRFAVAPDGVRIAWASVGSGPPLVKTANWLSHLEYDWKSPFWRHLARELSGEHQLIRYDQRGNGLSDWEVEDFSLEACVTDLEAVVQAAGLERFPLLGVSQGSRIAIAYAVKHPTRVSHLILYGGAARGWKHRAGSAREARSSLQGLIREGWGRDVAAFRQVFTTLFMPGATPEQAAAFTELQGVSTSADNAIGITEASASTDVTELLAQVQAPTLVLHATRDALVPFEEARLLAAGIPGARFVPLEGQNHLLLDDEPAFSRFLREVREHLSRGS
jgi:pimeloyl-ACP methyl ester carboxylesterase